ncbi:MAG: TIGR01777 family oxidoreductase [Solirubrobacterales bacterium]
MANTESDSQGKRKVVVTGASGLVGSALCNALIDLGDQVVGLSRSPEKSAQAQPAVQWLGWESTEERPPAEALDGADAVIHLAGEPINQRWNQEVKERIARSRIKSTKNMAEAITTSDNPPSVFLSGSAIGYYGDRGDELLYEDAVPGDDFLSGVVVDWEEAADSVTGTGTRVAKIRTGHVLDPKGGLLGELLTPFRLGVGGPIASGKQYMSWIHRDDEVGILLWALENEAAVGPINASAPNPVTNKEFSKRLGKAVNRPAFMPIPGFALDILRGPEFGSVLREGQRVYPRLATENGYEFKQPELAGALANLLR